MFQFAGFASTDLCIQSGILLSEWVSPFGYLRIKACLPAPRSFSQATTSFIACNRQGIHHMHLVLDPITVNSINPEFIHYRCNQHASFFRSQRRFKGLGTGRYNHNPCVIPSRTTHPFTFTSSEFLKIKQPLTHIMSND